ncbi:hypothetical protein BC628DRAFT_1348675 [Trametes gibbosa]|nr:hypothetical protein BC628DRAFT_1348675 [Trametes gibbosa]
MSLKAKPHFRASHAYLPNICAHMDISLGLKSGKCEGCTWAPSQHGLFSEAAVTAEEPLSGTRHAYQIILLLPSHTSRQSSRAGRVLSAPYQARTPPRPPLAIRSPCLPPDNTPLRVLRDNSMDTRSSATGCVATASFRWHLARMDSNAAAISQSSSTFVIAAGDSHAQHAVARVTLSPAIRRALERRAA